MGRAMLGGFAAGLLQGVDRGLQRKVQQEKEQRAEQRDQEIHNLRMGEAQRVEQDRARLADAAKPAVVGEASDLTHDDDGNPMPAVPRFRLESGTGVQRFDTKEQADAAAAGYNAPDQQGESPIPPPRSEGRSAQS